MWQRRSSPKLHQGRFSADRTSFRCRIEIPLIYPWQRTVNPEAS